MSAAMLTWTSSLQYDLTENEAELSFFNRQEYEAFLADPTTKW